MSIKESINEFIAREIAPALLEYCNTTDEVTLDGILGLFNVENKKQPAKTTAAKKGKAPACTDTHSEGQCSYQFKKGANTGKYCNTKTSEEFCTSHKSAKKAPKAGKITVKPGVNKKLTKSQHRLRKFRDGLYYDDNDFIIHLGEGKTTVVVGMRDGETDIRPLTEEEIELASDENLMVDSTFFDEKEDSDDNLVAMPSF